MVSDLKRAVVGATFFSRILHSTLCAVVAYSVMTLHYAGSTRLRNRRSAAVQPPPNSSRETANQLGAPFAHFTLKFGVKMCPS